MESQLPVELLTEIFHHTVLLTVEEPLTVEFDTSAKPWGVNCDSLDISKPPWTLSHVCSWWRSVALSTPEIWSYIFLRFNSRKAVKEDMFDALLSRSQNVPLHVMTDIDPKLVDSENNRNILVKLNATCSRWKTAAARTSASVSDITEECPLLEKTVGYVFFSYEGSMLPKLTDVAIFARLSKKDDKLFPQLKRLAWYFSGRLSANDLRQAEQLEHLRIASVSFSSIFVEDIEHRTIRKLDWLSNISWMASLTLPALEELFIANRAGVWGLDECLSMIRRSQCSIRKLSFEGRFQDTEIEELLSLCSQTLEEVEMAGCPSSLKGTITLTTLSSHLAQYSRSEYRIAFQIID